MEYINLVEHKLSFINFVQLQMTLQCKSKGNEFYSVMGALSVMIVNKHLKDVCVCSLFHRWLWNGIGNHFKCHVPILLNQ